MHAASAAHLFKKRRIQGAAKPGAVVIVPLPSMCQTSTKRSAAQAHASHAIGRCVTVALSAQVAGAAGRMHFATADKSIQGTLDVAPWASHAIEPEAMDLARLLGNIAPCGPFEYVAAPRPAPTNPQDTSLRALLGVPPHFEVSMSKANSTTQACVRRACWDTARVLGGGPDTGSWAMLASIGFALAAVAFAGAAPIHVARV